MKTNLILTLLTAILMCAVAVQAQTPPADRSGSANGHGVAGFVDENGDGFNDLAPDADGDGIPNGLDPDYVKPADGTGMQHKYGQAADGQAVKSGQGQNAWSQMLQHWNKFMNKFMPGGNQQASGGFGPGDGTALSGRGERRGGKR